MEAYKNIDTEIFTDLNVKKEKQTPYIFLFILIASVIIAYFTITSIGDGSITYGIVFVCAVLALFGLKGIIIPKSVFKFIKTGETLKRREVYYDIEQKGVVCDSVNKKNLKSLLNINQGKSGRVKVVFYSTPTNSYSVMQAMEYIPYEYVPATDVQVAMN